MTRAVFFAAGLLSTLCAVRNGHAQTPRRGARFLPGPVREISRTHSASRDAPVFEYAYGPRAQASAGGELAAVSIGRTRIGGSFLFAAENGYAKLISPDASSREAFENGFGNGLFPHETWRLIGELAVAHSMGSFLQHVLGDGSAAEVVFSLGREVAYGTDAFSQAEPISSRDIPFGGGGLYLKAEAGARIPIAERWFFETRLEYRWFTNAWLTLVGADEASDVVADALEEGLSHAPGFDLSLIWQLSESVAPLVAIHGVWLVPHDDSADSGYFARLLFSCALRGEAGALLPFVSLDAGNGKGLLMGRQEFRVSGGFRYAPW